MREIIIHQQFFTNADCYKIGKIITPKGIQVHSTGATNSYLKRYVGPNDGLLGKNEYNNTHNRPNANVCANAYIGRLNDGTPAIYQTLPWNMKCWLSANGSKGNANNMGYIGFEICEDNRKNREYFEQVVMGLSVNLVAYLCKKYSIPLTNVLDHSELHKAGIGSDHGDITWWLNNFQLNMNSYRKAVQAAMDEGVHVTYMSGNKVIGTDGDEEKKEETKPMTTLYQAYVVSENGKAVNVRASTSTSSTSKALLPVGTLVNVLQETNAKWDKISYNNITGYMMSEFLQRKGAETTPSVSVDKDKLEKLKKTLEDAIAQIDELLKEK